MFLANIQSGKSKITNVDLVSNMQSHIWSSNIDEIVWLMILFALSYRKQTDYIWGRVENILKKK